MKSGATGDEVETRRYVVCGLAWFVLSLALSSRTCFAPTTKGSVWQESLCFSL